MPKKLLNSDFEVAAGISCRAATSDGTGVIPRDETILPITLISGAAITDLAIESLKPTAITAPKNLSR